MRFDDRLLTVLSQPAGDRHDLAVRWRQLVDLVARSGPNGGMPAVAEALAVVQREARLVDEPLRAAAARAVAALPLPLGLLEVFAADTLTVAAPVLAAASLDRDQWQALMAVADDETQHFIVTLHPEMAPAPPLDLTDELVVLDGPPGAAEPVPETGPASAPAAANASLSDVVKRIERRRRSRAAVQGASAAPALATNLFRWECGPSGEINWVDGAPRGALIGSSIARNPVGQSGSPGAEVSRAFAMRAPFRDSSWRIAGEGSASGEWKLSGVPAFEPVDGRFAGYRGIALRATAGAPSDLPAMGVTELPDPDSLRELVHEIKTPLNAIIGFAEIIDGQFLGPADRRYRERAATIVEEARLLLSAIDDLDFAARLHASDRGRQESANLGELMDRQMASLRDYAETRGVEIDGSRAMRDLTAAITPELADRVIYKLCTAVIDLADRGERLNLSADRIGSNPQIAITRPSSIKGRSEAQLFSASDEGQEFSRMFALRLARGLAQIAGVTVVATRGAIALQFARR